MCGPCGGGNDDFQAAAKPPAFSSGAVPLGTDAFIKQEYLGIVIPPTINWSERAAAQGLKAFTLGQEHIGKTLDSTKFFKVDFGGRELWYSKAEASAVAQDIFKRVVKPGEEDANIKLLCREIVKQAEAAQLDLPSHEISSEAIGIIREIEAIEKRLHDYLVYAEREFNDKAKDGTPQGIPGVRLVQAQVQINDRKDKMNRLRELNVPQAQLNLLTREVQGEISKYDELVQRLRLQQEGLTSDQKQVINDMAKGKVRTQNTHVFGIKTNRSVEEMVKEFCPLFTNTMALSIVTDDSDKQKDIDTMQTTLREFDAPKRLVWTEMLFPKKELHNGIDVLLKTWPGKTKEWAATKAITQTYQAQNVAAQKAALKSEADHAQMEQEFAKLNAAANALKAAATPVAGSGGAPGVAPKPSKVGPAIPPKPTVVPKEPPSGQPPVYPPTS